MSVEAGHLGHFAIVRLAVACHCGQDALAETGRTTLFLAPGLQFVATERLFLDLSVQFPLWDEVGRGGLTSRWNALAQLRFAF